MELLYKYLNVKGAIHVLDEQRLRFAAATTFNDPLDCFWDVYWQVKSPDFERDIIEHAARMLVSHHIDDKKFATRDSRTRFYEVRQQCLKRSDPMESARQYIREIRSQKTQYDFDAIMANFQKHRSNLRILCMSRNPRSLSMWSQYADHSTGILLGFDKGHIPNKLHKFSGDVQYHQKLPEVFTAAQLAAPYHYQRIVHIDDVLRQLVLVKSNDWSYEHEFRFVSADFPGQPPYQFRPFPSEALRQVVFGERCSLSVEEKVRALLRHKYPNAETYRARPAPTDLSIDPFAVRLA